MATAGFEGTSGLKLGGENVMNMWLVTTNGAGEEIRRGNKVR
jgi:hypothetical protein